MASIKLNGRTDCETGRPGHSWEPGYTRGDTLNIAREGENINYTWCTRIALSPGNIPSNATISSINVTLPVTNNPKMTYQYGAYYFFSSKDLNPREALNHYVDADDSVTLTQGKTPSVNVTNRYNNEDYLYLIPILGEGAIELHCNSSEYPTVTVTYSAYPSSSLGRPNTYDSISDFTDYDAINAYFNNYSASGEIGSTISINYTNNNSNFTNRYVVITNSYGTIISVSGINSSSVTLPSSVGTYTGYLIGYYTPAGYYYRVDSISISASKSNTPPTLSNVNFNPTSGLSGQLTDVTVTFNASDADNDNLSVYYSSSHNPTESSSSVSNGGTISIYPGTTYYFRAYDGEDYSDEVSQELDSISLNVTLSMDGEADTSYYSSGGLKKNFIYLNAEARLNGSVNYSGTYSWYYKLGSSATSTNPTVSSQEYSIPGYSSSRIDNLDLAKVNPNVVGKPYQIIVKYNYNGAIASAESNVFVYPYPLNEISTYSYNNYNLTSSYANTNKEDFNDNMYLTIQYPTNAYRQYSKINQINLKIANSVSKEQLQNNSNFVTFFSKSLANISTSNSSGVGIQDNFTLNLSDSLAGSNLPENNYFKIQIELVDKVGQSNVTDLDEIFYRISKPTFGNTVIGSNRPQTIAVNQLSDDWTWQLSFNPGSSYNLTTYPLTDNGLKQQAIDTLQQVNLGLETLDGTIVSKTIALTDSNTSANYGSATVYLTITSSQLQSLLSEYTSLNTSLESTVKFVLEDPYGNIAELSSIRFPNSVLDDNVIFSFGTPPVLPDYSSSTYSLNPIYQYSTLKEGSFSTNLNTNDNSTKNMINFKDKLKFVFPIATDANGDDNGTVHGDILGYRIKIFRADTREEAQSAVADNFVVLSEIPFSSNTITYDSGNNNYTYNHDVNNYSTTKFVKIGICAYDSTMLESNLIIFPYIIVAGRIAQSSLNITSHKINTTESGTTYDFRVNFSDIGGNLFNNTGYRYSDYPNLERNITGNETDSRDVKFFIAYRNDSMSDFLTTQQLSFKTDKDSVSSINYDPTITYSALLTKTIRLDGVSFDSSIIDPNQKGYFKIIAQVQTGFNSDGTKLYTLSESPVYILYPSTPTVSYRKNAVGVNTSDLDTYIFRIAFAGGDRHFIRLDSAQVGTDSSAPYILIDINSIVPTITGIEISDED